MRPEIEFYPRTLARLLTRGVLRRDDKVLVTCGGVTDRDALATTGFENVVISNLDVRMRDGDAPESYKPFRWSFLPANRGF
jgi:hypothetical protein